MKKIIFICAGFFVLLIAFWVGIRMLGIFNTYKIVAAANEPNLPAGKIIMASNLKKPERFDFIVLKSAGERVIFRVCALEGDRVEMKDGEFYLNGKLAPQNYETMHNYTLSTKTYNTLIEKGIISFQDGDFASDSLVQTKMKDQVAKRAKVYANRHIELPNQPDQQISQKWMKPWNPDQFGPVTVPKDSYFVLGDSRNNAVDSRYIGFIGKQEFLGVVL